MRRYPPVGRMALEANGTSDSRRDRVRELARSDTGKAAGMAVAQLVANGVALAFVVVFARILGDDGYGSLGSLLSLFLILYVPGQALQVAVAREVSARVGQGRPGPGRGRAALDRAAAGRDRRRDDRLGPRARLAGGDHRRRGLPVGRRGRAGGRLHLDDPVGRARRHAGLRALRRRRLEPDRPGGCCGWPARSCWSAIGLDVTGAFLGSMVGFIFVAVALALPLQRELRARPRAHRGRRRAHEEHRLRDLFARSWAPLLALAGIAVVQNVDVIVVKHRFSEETASDWTAAAVAGKGVMWVAIGLGFWLVPEAAKRVHSGRDPRRALERALIGRAADRGAGAARLRRRRRDAARHRLQAPRRLGRAALARARASRSWPAPTWRSSTCWRCTTGASCGRSASPRSCSRCCWPSIDGGTTDIAMALCGVQAVLAAIVVTRRAAHAIAAAGRAARRRRSCRGERGEPAEPQGALA